MSARSGLIDDLYETGRVYPGDLAAFSERWGVDAAKLRRTLNLAVHCMALPIGSSNKRVRDELRVISETGAAFAEAIDRASDPSVVHWLIWVPEVHPPLLLGRPDAFRNELSKAVRRLVEQARTGADALEVSKAPHASGRSQRSPPSHEEKSVVGPLAHLWHETHGVWPKVTTRRPNGMETRGANEGGRFVIEAASLLELEICVQRLRTVLKEVLPRGS